MRLRILEGCEWGWEYLENVNEAGNTGGIQALMFAYPRCLADSLRLPGYTYCVRSFILKKAFLLFCQCS